MPVGAARIVIYPNDHDPAHVHVLGPVEAILVLNCPDGPPVVRGQVIGDRRRLDRIKTEVGSRLDLLCDAWEQLHVYQR